MKSSCLAGGVSWQGCARRTSEQSNVEWSSMFEETTRRARARSRVGGAGEKIA